MPLVAKKLFTLDMVKAHQRYHNAAGKRVKGVTTVLDVIEKHGLHKWYYECGLDGIDPVKARDAAAAIGTVAHARVEAYLRGMELDESRIAPVQLEKSANSFQSFLDWWHGESLTVVESEFQMVSEKWQTGGTLDILATRPSDRLLLVDIKTSNSIWNEHYIQAAAYAEMWNELHPERLIDEVWIAQLPKDESGRCRTYEVKAEDRPLYVASFVDANNLYESLKRLPRIH